jgi:hypothetical protein
MALFDAKNFNGEVFANYVDAIDNLNRNELIKSGAVVNKPQYAALAPDQTGGDIITVPIKARITGTADNYNGSTNINSSSRKTYTHTRVVTGRAYGWVEKDFSSDITGEDFEPAAAEIAEYWDDVDQVTLLAVLSGIYAMTGTKNLEFVNGHTYDITDESVNNTFGATTLNNAIQKALGDNKGKFALAIMHSQVATTLENLNLVDYCKYTDSNGIERSMELATLNGRLVLIDDNMPVDQVADTAGVHTLTISANSIENDEIAISYNGETVTYTVPAGGKTIATLCTALELALEANQSFTTDFTINKTSTTVTFTQKVAGTGAIPTIEITQTTEGTIAGSIATSTAAVVGYNEYTTYVLGQGAIEYTDMGVKVPYEMDRNPATNGGETTLYTRQRKIFAPFGISWTGGNGSPTNAALATGSNWQLANSNESPTKEYFPHKAIPICRIVTRG